ncbi:VPDSG-CTERM sorting domain-containing protein [Puniceicoccaceae bacterium K14]|nr:VPDSG-CTERM sorting domain-containing protein [Puniceicoccaceae bacterium K14]
MIKTLAALAAIAISSSAMALSYYTFDFTTGGNSNSFVQSGNSLTFWDTTHTISLTATGQRNNANSRVLQFSLGGLYVKNANDTRFQIDGHQGNDLLTLDLGSSFKFVEAYFYEPNIEGNDDVNIRIDGSFQSRVDVEPTLDLSPYSGSSVGFRAVQNNDNFTVTGLKVAKVPDGGSTLAFMSLGIGGLFVARKRLKK